jgi:cysteinyl-tRNA synthetase
LNFTFAALDAAKASLARIDEFAERLRSVSSEKGSGGADSALLEKTRQYFVRSLDNDLNISEALAAVFELVRDGNKALDQGTTPADAAAMQDLLLDFDRVLGFIRKDAVEDAAAVAGLAAEREQSRKNRDWAGSDRLRLKIAELGWEVRDTPEGPKLKRKTR